MTHCRYYLGGGGSFPMLCAKPWGHEGSHSHVENLSEEWNTGNRPQKACRSRRFPGVSGPRPDRKAERIAAAIERAEQAGARLPSLPTGVDWVFLPKSAPSAVASAWERTWAEFEAHGETLDRRTA